MNAVQSVTVTHPASQPTVEHVHSDSTPSNFASQGDDLKAIETLLASYTLAVSTKDEESFRKLMLDQSIPFSSVARVGRTSVETQNYDAFRKAVFEGVPFTQQFRKVRIEQDGGLANVTLVFENTRSDGGSWGWKTMLLLKVDDSWKIASEFYTSHPSK